MPNFRLPSRFPTGSEFLKLDDGRIVWVDPSGMCRTAFGQVLSGFATRDSGSPATEAEFRVAVAMHTPPPAPPVNGCLVLDGRISRNDVERAREVLSPKREPGAPQWHARRLRLFPVLDPQRKSVGEVWIGMHAGKPHFGRTAFINKFEESVPIEQAILLLIAAEREDWATLDAFHPEALPWYCRHCARNYAESEWRIFTRSDDGFLDDYRGICPQGHERMIAD